MEQNTDRMWWTIGAVVLGGALIAAIVLLLNTTLLPNIKTKFDEIDRPAVTKPNWNLLDGTSSSLTTKSANGWGTPGSLTTNHVYFTIGQSYTYSAWIQDCDVDTRAAIYLFDSDGFTPCLGNIIPAGSSGLSTVTFKISDDITRYETSIGFTENKDSYHSLSYAKLKLEPGLTATQWMPSPS